MTFLERLLVYSRQEFSIEIPLCEIENGYGFKVLQQLARTRDRDQSVTVSLAMKEL